MVVPSVRYKLTEFGLKRKESITWQDQQQVVVDYITKLINYKPEKIETKVDFNLLKQNRNIKGMC